MMAAWLKGGRYSELAAHGLTVGSGTESACNEYTSKDAEGTIG
jgi:hypothetical protein